MAIAFDTSATGGQIGSTPASGSFNITGVGTLTNGMVIVSIEIIAWTGTLSIPSATFGGNAMLLGAGFIDNTIQQAFYIFYLANPPSGTTSIAWAQGVTKGQFVAVSSGTYSGVQQAGNPFETSANNTVGTGATSLDIIAPSITGQDWGLFFAISGRSLTASTNVTQRQNPSTNTFYGDSNGPITTGTTQTVTMTTGTTSDGLVAYMLAAIATASSGNFLMFM